MGADAQRGSPAPPLCFTCSTAASYAQPTRGGRMEAAGWHTAAAGGAMWWPLCVWANDRQPAGLSFTRTPGTAGLCMPAADRPSTRALEAAHVSRQHERRGSAQAQGSKRASAVEANGLWCTIQCATKLYLRWQGHCWCSCTAAHGTVRLVAPGGSLAALSTAAAAAPPGKPLVPRRRTMHSCGAHRESSRACRKRRLECSGRSERLRRPC